MYNLKLTRSQLLLYMYIIIYYYYYYYLQSELRISVLPTHLSYDSYWSVRKVPLKATPHFVGYHMESKVGPIIIQMQRYGYFDNQYL